METADTPNAGKVVLAWLALLDAKDYEKSWSQAAGFFRAEVPAADWSERVGVARQPLGEMLERVMTSCTSEAALPGAPAGDYRVFKFAARFSQRPDVVETVTLMRESDDSWSVAGYFVA